MGPLSVAAVSSSAMPAVTVALAIVAYLAGSIPFGLLFGRVFAGKDVRSSGSGNIGAANVSRVAGNRVAALTLLADLLKGLVPVLVGRWLGLNPIDLAVVAGLTVLGHDFSIFLRLKGGKGVATTLGAAAGLAIPPAASAALIWLLIVAIARVSALGSLVALWSLALFMAVFDQPPEFVCLAFGLSLLSVYTHRENLARMSGGQENRVGRA